MELPRSVTKVLVARRDTVREFLNKKLMKNTAQLAAVHGKLVSFIWSIADDVLRDVFLRGQYRDVILGITPNLPLTSPLLSVVLLTELTIY